jgi:hypothetical protein
MNESTYRIWTQRHTLWKDRCASADTPLATTTPTSLALAIDRQHNNTRNLHTHTLLCRFIILGCLTLIVEILSSSSFFQLCPRSCVASGCGAFAVGIQYESENAEHPEAPPQDTSRPASEPGRVQCEKGAHGVVGSVRHVQTVS